MIAGRLIELAHDNFGGQQFLFFFGRLLQFDQRLGILLQLKQCPSQPLMDGPALGVERLPDGQMLERLRPLAAVLGHGGQPGLAADRGGFLAIGVIAERLADRPVRSSRSWASVIRCSCNANSPNSRYGSGASGSSKIERSNSCRAAGNWLAAR